MNVTRLQQESGLVGADVPGQDGRRVSPGLPTACIGVIHKIDVGPCCVCLKVNGPEEHGWAWLTMRGQET